MFFCLRVSDVSNPRWWPQIEHDLVHRIGRWLWEMTDFCLHLNKLLQFVARAGASVLHWYMQIGRWWSCSCFLCYVLVMCSYFRKLYLVALHAYAWSVLIQLLSAVFWTVLNRGYDTVNYWLGRPICKAVGLWDRCSATFFQLWVTSTSSQFCRRWQACGNHHWPFYGAAICHPCEEHWRWPV